MGYATKCFSKRLKELRETAGLTQAQLASELKVSRGAISYYEKGERTPDIEFLDAVSEYFNIPLDFAIGYTNNIKEEYKNMYDFYGLTDQACEELDHSPKIGNLISAILGHKDFYALKCLYERLLKNYKTFDIDQMGYIGFLMSDSLNKIIFDSLKFLWSIQFTPEESAALRIESENSKKAIENLLQHWNEEKERKKEKWAEEDAELEKRDREENAVQYSAMEKIYEKFYETIDHVEFRRQHP